MIPPTVGRVLLYRPKFSDPNAPPLAAMIAAVNDNGSVNIGFLTAAGDHRSATNVMLYQEGEPRPDTAETAFCEWMPFQIGQAKQQSMVAGVSLGGEREARKLARETAAFKRDEALDTNREAKLEERPEEEEEDKDATLLLEQVPTEENTRPDVDASPR